VVVVVMPPPLVELEVVNITLEADLAMSSRLKVKLLRLSLSSQRLVSRERGVVSGNVFVLHRSRSLNPRIVLVLQPHPAVKVPHEARVVDEDGLPGLEVVVVVPLVARVARTALTPAVSEGMTAGRALTLFRTPRRESPAVGVPRREPPSWSVSAHRRLLFHGLLITLLSSQLKSRVPMTPLRSPPLPRPPPQKVL
jgi:hypothetical protein